MTTRRRQRSRLHLYAAIGVLASALAVQTGLNLRESMQEPADFYGEPAKSGPSVLAQRIGCRIARFGLRPWAAPGTPWTTDRRAATRIALRDMGLPPGAALLAAAAMETAAPDDVVGMGNRGGVGMHGKTFEPAFDTSYRSIESGRVVCHHSRTNFAVDTRAEYAPIWRIEHEGAVYWAGEFMACGNVSRFYEGPAIGPRQVLAQPQQLPEPGAGGLVLAALLAWGLSRRFA
jgi:hypothetical protein